MRVFEEEKIKAIYCNKCGRKIKVENGIVKEGILSVDKRWDYFSEKDGVRHSFDLCEECYNRITEKFKYPVEKTEYSELI